MGYEGDLEIAMVPESFRVDVLKESLDANKVLVENANVETANFEMFENIAYVMAKHADANIPDTPEEWLDGFNTFSIYQVLPQLIELWGLNVQTDVSAKKNFVQQIAR